MAHDDEELKEEPPRPRYEYQGEGGGGDDKDLPSPPEKNEEPDLDKPRRRKRKRRRRDRSILRSDEPVSPFTLQQGWLDGLFAGPNLIILLAVTFFCSPLMFWVAIFAAITASDPEARRNAFAVIGFCLLQVLLAGCVVCIGKAMNPS